MATKKKKIHYLTKAITERAARKGFIKASETAMAEMGYIVIAEKGWVVKKFPDGSIEKISQIEQVNLPNGFHFG